jgi:hypothetical protein
VTHHLPKNFIRTSTYDSKCHTSPAKLHTMKMRKVETRASSSAVITGAPPVSRAHRVGDPLAATARKTLNVLTGIRLDQSRVISTQLDLQNMVIVCIPVHPRFGWPFPFSFRASFGAKLCP